MERPTRLALLSFPLLLLVGVSARAEVPASCQRDGMTPHAYLDCLGNAQKDSEKRLTRTMAGAMAAIRADEAISPVQRTRWTNLLDEAQGRFVYWRNFECQSIAPYEGGGAKKTVGGRLGGIGTLEQRLVCLIETNNARIADIARRYPPPSGWTYAEPPPPQTTQAPAPRAPVGPIRIIEMPGQP